MSIFAKKGTVFAKKGTVFAKKKYMWGSPFCVHLYCTTYGKWEITQLNICDQTVYMSISIYIFWYVVKLNRKPFVIIKSLITSFTGLI